MKYQVFPLVVEHGQSNIPEEVLARIWAQMVEEGKAQKTFYNGYVTSAFDFVDFLKSGGPLAILIADNDEKRFCHIAWITDYADGHACLHHCSLGKFKRGAAKAILKYYEQFQNPDNGGPAFNVLVGITPENNEDAIRVARLMGFKIVGTIPQLCQDVYKNSRVGGVISYYQYHHGTLNASHVESGGESWAVEEKAAQI